MVKAQAAMADALFFVLTVSIATLIMWRTGFLYGESQEGAMRQAIFRLYVKSALNSLLFATIPRGPGKDYLLAYLKDQYAKQGTLTESDLQKVIEAAKKVFGPLTNKYDIIIAFGGSVNKAVAYSAGSWKICAYPDFKKLAEKYPETLSAKALLLMIRGALMEAVPVTVFLGPATGEPVC